MSLSRVMIFIIGCVLALFGLFMVIQHYNEIQALVIGLVLIVVGVVLLSGRVLTL
ncbi:MAG TPA: hypothetical protein VI461_11520 [Chitinophagaceae bacterium]|nr:hypothetical protein [Chitinophagaceae bacterium]